MIVIGGFSHALHGPSSPDLPRRAARRDSAGAPPGAVRGRTQAARAGPADLSVWNRLVRVSVRFTSLLAGFQEGRLRPLREPARRSDEDRGQTLDSETED